MSTENKTNNRELMKKLQQARGLVGECIAGLEAQSVRRPKKGRALSRSHKPQAAFDPDFDVHKRAFEIQLKEIEKHWNKMTAPSLLGGEFNSFYTNGAKEKGWVNTKKAGAYLLRPSWQDIFK